MTRRQRARIESSFNRTAGIVLVLVGGCSSSLPDDWLYSTRVTSDAATVVWTMPGATAVTCRDRAGNRAAAAAEQRDDLRVARVTGLAPAQAYRCRVFGRTAPRAGRLRFRTAPRDGAPFRFAVVGDSGDGSLQARGLVAVILAGNPDLLVHLGDLAYPHGTLDELDTRFFEPYRALLERVPVLPTPGNHDLRRGGAYRRAFAPVADVDDAGGPRAAIDRPSALLLSIASPTVTADADAVDWVGKALAAPPVDRWRIAFLHEPLYAPPQPKFVTRGLRRVLGPLLEAGRVDVVFAGHQHLYARSQPSCADVPEARTVHVISGGGGAQIDQPFKRHPSFPVVEPTTHYVRVDLTRDALELQAINLYGEVIDHARLTRADASPCRARDWPRARERDR